MDPKRCKTCGEELTSHTCYPSDMRDGRRRCKKCSYKQRREIYDKRKELEKEASRERYYTQGGSSYSENNKCSMHLGVYIAENLIENMFEDIVRAPMHNKGYDFILKSGETIDVKASNLSVKNNWFFNINRNTTPDYFLCVAFDNNKPIHMWMIPGIKINTKKALYMSPNTVEKWKEYEKVIQ